MGVDPDEDEYASDDEPMAQASVFFFSGETARRGTPAKQGEYNHGKFMENTSHRIAQK
jgi:hypothetical protein